MHEHYDGLRSFLAECEKLGEVKIIRDADWNLEIGALTEMVSELIDEPPALMFDEIKGYPKGFRVLSIPTASRMRMAIALGLSPDTPKMEIVRHAAQRIKHAPPIPPKEVETGPVMANVMRDNEVDLLRFPVLQAHKGDGGRYIGTGDTFINRDPETGYVNMGTYRMQVHERNLLGIWQSPGQQGRLIAERYWKQGKACPVVATFGGDPLLFFLSYTKFPFGVSELDRAGGILGRPVEVIKGPLTGLPIPAHAEIVIEGEMPPPDVESHMEGPFGEWPGYYTVGAKGSVDEQPVIRVKAIYYRNDPILLNMAPQWPGAPHHSVRFEGGILWEQLEAVGAPGTSAHMCTILFVVVAIKQQYAGHASRRHGGARLLRVRATGVLWSSWTRISIPPTHGRGDLGDDHPRRSATDIEIVENCWATPLDPRMPPEQTANGPHTNSRAIYYAVRPWAWRDKFPPVNRIDKDQRAAILKKYGGMLPFPRR
jgi:4-hydroxy-3-polyprenylbenzoate decarboxylase